MRVDAHQHFWKVSRNDYGWLTPEVGSIYRDCLPDELRLKLERNNIDKTILVQAAPTTEETLYIMELANNTPYVAGVVGWVDMEAYDAPQQIARLAQSPKLAGLRPMFQDIADPDWMLSDKLTPAFTAMIEHGLRLDALILPHHLENLLTLLSRHPDLHCVVDHCAKPRIALGQIDDWANGMHAIGQETNAYCKLSGILTEAGTRASVEALAPYIKIVLEAFGPKRLMWGSDWPVLEMASDYDSWCMIAEELTSDCSATEKEAIFSGTAIDFYGIEHTSDCE